MSLKVRSLVGIAFLVLTSVLPATAGDPPAAAAGSLTAFVDPETGKIVEPTPEQRRAFAEKAEAEARAKGRRLDRSDEGLVPFNLRRGGRGLNLRGRFRSALPAPDLAAKATIQATLGFTADKLAGTDADGRVYLYTPDPLEPGSSVSHWDPSAFPNLLMEPSINSDLGRDQVDLTTFFFRDIGWQQGTSQMILHNEDAAGQGLNDPSLGAQRLAAIEHVAGFWGNRLHSTVEINVSISFDALTCGAEGGTLAQAGPEFLYESFAGAPVAGFWYPGALAEALSGENLSLEDNANPDAADLSLTFNSDIDDSCLGGTSRFYYGLDGNTPAGQINFVQVALHEMAHGLGFVNFVNESTGGFPLGTPDIASRSTYDNDEQRFWHQMTNAQRKASAINFRDVVFAGIRTTNQAPTFLNPAPVLTVTAPPAAAGTYEVGTANFGPSLGATLRSELVAAVDSSGQPTLLCGPAANAAALDGKIAFVDRGECLFVEKSINAQNAGAIAIVIANNVDADGALPLGGDDARVRIPAVSLSREDGQRIRDALEGTADAGSVAFANAIFVADEGGGAATVRLQRSGGTDGVLSVDVATVATPSEEGSATPGEDYTPFAATLRFGDGVGGFRSFQVPILDDDVTEGEEKIRLELSNVTGGELGKPSVAVLSIDDNDDNPAGFLSFGDTVYQFNEGDGEAVIQVTRSGGSTGAVSVDVMTGGAGAGPTEATPGDDYLPLDTTVDFADGESGSRDVRVTLVDDDVEENVEAFGVALANPTGGALLGAPSSTRVSLVDNEACAANDSRLCLNGGRFRTEIRWRKQNDETGPGQVVTSSDDSGLFYFFNPDNWEMMVKVLDGCAANGRFWVFAAATTNVEYTLTVTDTVTGVAREYVNPLGVSAPAITDTDAFASCPSGASSPPDGPDPEEASAAWRRSFEDRGASGGLAAKADCAPDATHLCLNEGRFQVEVDWRAQNDRTGRGAEALTSEDSGVLWFFSKQNWEMMVKVLDGCRQNGHYWVFAAATTNVEYTLTVTDTETGDVVRYKNPLGVSASAITDTTAFSTCP